MVTPYRQADDPNVEVPPFHAPPMPQTGSRAYLVALALGLMALTAAGMIVLVARWARPPAEVAYPVAGPTETQTVISGYTETETEWLTEPGLGQQAFQSPSPLPPEPEPVVIERTVPGPTEVRTVTKYRTKRATVRTTVTETVTEHHHHKHTPTEQRT